jgi:hypothetical protein
VALGPGRGAGRRRVVLQLTAARKGVKKEARNDRRRSPRLEDARREIPSARPKEARREIPSPRPKEARREIPSPRPKEARREIP